jgi:hypothetical protein
MLLRAGPTGSGRPDEVIAALGLLPRRIHRLRLGLEDEDPRRSVAGPTDD